MNDHSPTIFTKRKGKDDVQCKQCMLSHCIKNISISNHILTNIALEEEVRQAAAKESKELKLFWKDYLPLLRSAPETSLLHDIARFDYMVQTGIIPEDMEDAEKKVSLKLFLIAK